MIKPKISIITPSIRPEFLDITQECLEKQTFQDFEWVVEIGLRNRGYTLPSDWNKLISRCKGDIIVMIQDCIRVDDDFLEKVSKLDFNKKAYTFPVSKVMKWGDEPSKDWRSFFESRAIQPHQWETDLAAAPRDLFYTVGGFDEEFDKGWSWENVEIAHRASFAGYSFDVIQDMGGIALDHDRIKPNPFRGKRENNDQRANVSLAKAAIGDWKLTYLVEPLLMNDGEIADRLSILRLKNERLNDPNIKGELEVYEKQLSIKPHLKSFVDELYVANGATWDLESDIRRGKENELGLEEVGRRAIAIRECNKKRIEIKNRVNTDWFKEIKIDHASK